VKLLEEELCVVLFTRANKRVFLTERGNLLLSHVRAIFDQVTQASQAVSQVSKGVTHHLNLGTGTTILNFFLPPVFEEYKRRFPTVAIHIKTGAWPVVLEDLRNGALEVVIGCLPTPLEARDYWVRPLYREELVVAVAKHHPLAGRKVIEPRELNDTPLITFPSNHATRQVLESLFRELSISPQIEIELENDEALLGCVAKNMGVAFVPRRLAIQQKIHFLRIADIPVFRTVGLVSLRSRQTSEHIRRFSDLCIVRAKSVFPSDLPLPGASQKTLSQGLKTAVVPEVQLQNA
jgi:LysR family cyn operon transcriptional activator